MFSDEYVRAVQDVSGWRAPADVIRSIMTKTAELLAARGGTMTTERVEQAVRLVEYADAGCELREHIAALSARNAVLEERLATAVKALDQENGIVAQIQERLSAADEANRELVRRAQHAESMAELREKDRDVWNRRLDAAAEELSDVGAGEVGRFDIVSRVRMLKARCSALSAAGQVLSAHVDRQWGSPESIAKTLKATGKAVEASTRHPCSTTCTHDDAATPGHPERVKERGEAWRRTVDYEQGAEAMRAACWDAVQEALRFDGVTPEGQPGMWNHVKSSIEGATP